MASANGPSPDLIEGERTIPSVNAKRSKSRWRGLLFLLIFLLAAVGFGVAWYWNLSNGSKGKAPPPQTKEEVKSGAPPKSFSAAPPPPPPPAEALESGAAIGLVGEGAAEAPGVPAPAAPPSSAAGPQVGSAAAPVPAPKPTVDKSAAGLMVTSNEVKAPSLEEIVRATSGSGARAERTSDEGGMAELLSGTRTAASRAAFMPNRNFLLPKGAILDCVLQTRIVSTVPGLAKCILTRDVFSSNGKVLLMERGSQLDGEYGTGMQQGQDRLFVVWNELRTPRGVVVGLGSPGTDPLGGSGIPGRVNRHFWQRFGAAMLISIVDDAAAAVAQREQQNGTTVNLGNSSQTASDMANTVLESSANIPPTLYKNHGERISIVVARDVDFSEVYALEASP